MPPTQSETRQLEPEFYERLGRLVTHWALLEGRLADLLAACLHADPSMTVMLSNTVSGATVTDWIRKMSSLQNNPAEAVEELEDILNEIDELRAERNALVHGLWVTSASDTGTVLVRTLRLHPTHPTRQRVITLVDLGETIEVTLGLYERLGAFLRRQGIPHL